MSTSGFCIDAALIDEATALVEILRSQRVTVVTAESCSGGLIAAALAHAPAAGECLHGGFVAYTKEHKALALGVSYVLLEQSGSVTTEVASQMALGALKRSPADLAISATGVLGPKPDEDGNPPGLVYFGLARRHGEPRVIAQHFADDDPHQVRRAVVLRAVALLREAVE